ncbi:plasma membrane fusion protein prm1, partial [Coemansia sp. IMI 209127]
DLFGPVEEGTSQLNDTLNDFINTYIGGVRKVFGDNFLETAIEGLLNCTLTKNIETLQKILTWFNELASGVTLPQVSDNLLLDPVETFLGPLNNTIKDVRELVVGDYVIDAKALDPSKFPTSVNTQSSSEESSESELESGDGLDSYSDSKLSSSSSVNVFDEQGIQLHQ